MGVSIIFIIPSNSFAISSCATDKLPPLGKAELLAILFYGGYILIIDYYENAECSLTLVED